MPARIPTWSEFTSQSSVDNYASDIACRPKITDKKVRLIVKGFGEK